MATQEAYLQSRSKFFQNALRDGKKVSFREHVFRSWESVFFVGGGVNLSASTIAQRFDTLGPLSIRIRIGWNFFPAEY